MLKELGTDPTEAHNRTSPPIPVANTAPQHTERSEEVVEETLRTWCAAGEFQYVKKGAGGARRLRDYTASPGVAKLHEDATEEQAPITATTKGTIMSGMSEDQFRVILLEPGSKGGKMISTNDPEQLRDIKRTAVNENGMEVPWLDVNEGAVAVLLSSTPIKYPTYDGKKAVDIIQEQGIEVAASMVYRPNNKEGEWAVVFDNSNTENLRVSIFSPDEDSFYELRPPKKLNQKMEIKTPPTPRTGVQDGEIAYPVNPNDHPFDFEGDIRTYPPFRYMMDRFRRGERLTPKQLRLEIFTAQQAHALNLMEEDRGNLVVPEDVRAPIESRFESLRGPQESEIYLDGRGPDVLQSGDTFQDAESLFRELAVDINSLSGKEDIGSNRAKRRHFLTSVVFVTEASLVNSTI